MKYLLILLASVHTLHAAESPLHNTSLYLLILFLILLILSIYAYFVRKCEEKNRRIQEKEEQLLSLHRSNSEQEKESIHLLSQKEKEILSLRHTISDLERRLQEGTKNQVVAKIEALQKKRRQSSK